MTPTPRTDALVEQWDFSPLPKVMEAHARQLERELEEANANYKLAHSELGAHVLLLASHKAALEKCKSVLTSIRRGEYSGGIDEALTAINELLK